MYVFIYLYICVCLCMSFSPFAGVNFRDEKECSYTGTLVQENLISFSSLLIFCHYLGSHLFRQIITKRKANIREKKTVWLLMEFVYRDLS